MPSPSFLSNLFEQIEVNYRSCFDILSKLALCTAVYFFEETGPSFLQGLGASVVLKWEVLFFMFFFLSYTSRLKKKWINTIVLWQLEVWM